MHLRGRGLVAQLGGPTRVINQTLVSIIREARLHSTIITELWGSRFGISGLMTDNFTNLYAQPDDVLDAVAATPGSALGASRLKIGTEPGQVDPELVAEVIIKYQIRYGFLIGGNDTALNAQNVDEILQSRRYEAVIMHVPKTIDNDVYANDHTPGFGSAGLFVASAHSGSNMEARSLPKIKVNVVMGRDSGFLAATAALARQEEGDAPHHLYFPERPFSEPRFLDDIAVAHENYGSAVVTVSEGIRYVPGDKRTLVIKSLQQNQQPDSFGHYPLAGNGVLADYLANLVKKHLGMDNVRADTYGYPQRSLPLALSLTDSYEADLAGTQAVRFSLKGPSRSVTMVRQQEGEYRVWYVTTPLEEVAGITRQLPDDFISASGTDVTAAFLQYARPIVGDMQPMGRLLDIPVQPTTTLLTPTG